MASVTIKNVRKFYTLNNLIIKDVNLEIKDREFVVIVGPSGCGKSTLLRTIAGLETINAGEIYIDNVLVNHLEPKERNIAMVFQSYALYPHMNVFKNISYALRISGVPKKEIISRVHKTAEMLQLTPYLDRKPSQLSGGQRQRVAMGRALIREPKVFLFDEPLSNLDAKLRVQTRIEIKKLHQNTGVTSVFVTHDQVEAMTLADKLVVMNQGNFEQVGTPIDIYEKPATLFVAGFIGSPPMNLIKGILEKPQQIRFETDFVLKLPKPFTDKSYLGKEIVLGMRAEEFVLSNKSQANFFIHLDLIEELGNEKIICGTFVNPKNKKTMYSHHYEQTPQNVYASFPNKLKELQIIKENNLKMIPLKINFKNLHFFDPTSQKRID